MIMRKPILCPHGILGKKKCNECNNAYNRDWRSKHRSKTREYHRKEKQKLRLEVLTHYGGNPPKCACCGEMIYEFLTIDHINNDGAKHRESIGVGAGSNFYQWLKNNNFPEGFQVLCRNCNWGKKLYGKCPHQKV